MLAAGWCGFVHAQSDMTVYGVMDYGVITLDADGSNRRNALDSGLTAGSRVGFKGTEDLGNGARVGFLLEAGFESDSGETAFGGLFSRQAWLNVAGRYGELRVGRQYTFGYEWFPQITPFSTLYGQAGLKTIFGYKNVGDRISNSVFYFTPGFEGFEGGVGYSRSAGDDESGGNENDHAVKTAGMRYKKGPLLMVLTYDRKEDAKSSSKTERDAIGNLTLGATYDFGAIKMHAGAGQLKNRDFDAHAKKEKSWLLGFSVPIGGTGSLFGTWQHVNAARNLNENGIRSSRRGAALGYTHKLSRRTNLYVFASHYKNVGKRENDPSRLGDATEYAFGVKHTF